ncbi:MAG TPA: outer membrane lipoprotein carrier protein LolA [Kofleriaceae bacterium]|nr:outer membrane lipoprotein carrier protein LolA [Kofleriaceae bacterium]
MIDLIAIVTRTWLGMHAPAGAQIVTAPLVAAPAAGVAATAAAQPSAAEVVDNIQKFYANIKHVTAQFRQTVTNATFGSTKTSDGKVYLAKPGKMRWDYLEKKGSTTVFKKSFISNGTTLYDVEHDNKQVIKKDLKQDLMPVAVTFLYGSGDLKREFNAEPDGSGQYGTKGDLVIKLTPKTPSAQYKNLILVVSPTDYHVKESIIIDSSNNTNHFMFYAPDFDKPIEDSWFEFDPRSVRDYRVIDADQPQGSGSATKP